MFKTNSPDGRVNGLGKPLSDVNEERQRLIELCKECERDIARRLEELSGSHLKGATGEQEIATRLLDAAGVRLQALKDALRSMDEGTYGICRGCGERIEQLRLENVIGVTTCIRCQQEIDDTRISSPSSPRSGSEYADIGEDDEDIDLSVDDAEQLL